jgi:RNA polymerase sigma factor (sigma-70 family)
VIDEPTRRLDEGALRALIPRVLAGLVRRGEDFYAAEDALQEAVLEALRVWPEHQPRDPRAWLATVATRRLVDARRSEAARHRREEATYAKPQPGAIEEGDDTLFLLFCCCHPDLAPASQVALTLRAVGGLTTREIADAFYVPEATMAQRISRAKRTLQGRRLDQPGDLAVVLRVLYLVYTAGHAGRVDLAGEAIRLARQLTLATEEPEARGLLALMLLNHARLPARLDSAGRIVTLDRQDRGLWDTREIAEGVRVLQSALAVHRPGRYQVEAAIAALHDDAASAEETDWPQILAWYDDLLALTDDPVRQDPAAVLGRAVAVGHVLGAAAGLRETDRLREVLGERHRWHAVRGYLHELSGDLPAAVTAYADAARRATDVAERDHLVRQAARARAAELRRNTRLTERPPWEVRSSYGGGRVGASAPRQGLAGPRVRAAAGRSHDGARCADVAVAVLPPVPGGLRRYTVRLPAGQAGGTGDGAVAPGPHVRDRRVHGRGLHLARLVQLDVHTPRR